MVINVLRFITKLALILTSVAAAFSIIPLLASLMFIDMAEDIEDIRDHLCGPSRQE